MSKVRVRYAPSPTGYLHIGGARSALFNYLYAKKFDGDFVFRVEDTDIERNIEGAEESQYNDLVWLGVIPDESPLNPVEKYAPYRQTEKLELYRQYAYKLVEMGYAYECFCTEDELAEMKENQLASGVKSFKYNRHCLNLTKEEKEKYLAEGRKPSIRIKMEANVDLGFDDLVRGPVKFNSSDIGDFVILKSNGIPTYNFAVVIDDHIMEITHVLRGEEHLSNTPKQLQIYKYFGWEPPKFGHMTIIVNQNGKKLSKRDNNIIQFVSQYRKLGYLPEAILNFLLLLGWTPEDNKEIFTLDEAVKAFDPARLSSSPSMFDDSKLTWINSHYIKNLSDEKYFEFILPFLKKVEKLQDRDEEELKNIALIYKEEISYGEQIVELVSQLFKDSYELTDEEKEFVNSENSKLVCSLFAKKVENCEVSKDSLKNLFKEIQNETGLKGKDLYMPIRLKLTGVEHGVELYNIVRIIGKEEAIKRAIM
ncbi:MAG: glutamate--tRNA ligase [Bacilli bacterium]|nr:glutamate--tRNA ligase [Bacilli bacterium]